MPILGTAFICLAPACGDDVNGRIPATKRAPDTCWINALTTSKGPVGRNPDFPKGCWPFGASVDF